MSMTKIGLLILVIAMIAMPGAAQKKKRMSDFCTPDGKAGVKCGGSQYMSCIELHPDICDSEDVLPSCCAASPLSPDQTAVSCHCCAKHAQLSEVTIPYDDY